MQTRYDNDSDKTQINFLVGTILVMGFVIALMTYFSHYGPKKEPEVPISNPVETVFICLYADNADTPKPQQTRIICTKWVKGMESIQELTNQPLIYGWVTTDLRMSQEE